MTIHSISLNDKYDLEKDRAYMTGTQALVRLCLEQSHRDKTSGLTTGGYISGYRGSPLGAVDFQFQAAKQVLEPQNIKFSAALNEDLAATAIWGTQQVGLQGDGAFDGVFSLWYGKGPGVDRSGDVFRHGNLAGSSKTGGVLVVTGDDHTCESSTTAHQSDYALVDAQIPILYPASVRDILEFGLHGWAMSRFAGVWVGLKCVKDNVESAGSVDVDLSDITPLNPPDYIMPEGGLNIRRNDPPVVQETRLHQHKLNAVRAYAFANGLDKVTHGDKKAKIGIVTTGKSYLDVLLAFEALGLSNRDLKRLGVAVYKIAMTWPLEPKGIATFCEGKSSIIVVEEKRGLIEDQLKTLLFDLKKRPKVIGKKDEFGETLFPAQLALNPIQIARALATRIGVETPKSQSLLKSNELPTGATTAPAIERAPAFCAGCPHNRSTIIPDGSKGFAGIGCHWMALLQERGVEGYTHMGGEGANWIGEAPFSKIEHAFQQMGDGTFNHSGLMAIRGAVAANVNMTYKLLFNDAVAMTGGQTNDGGKTSYDMLDEIIAAGVKNVAYVTEDPSRIDRSRLADFVSLHHRNELARVQREFQSHKGVSLILYDQTCATELRRRRKRGLIPDVNKRVFINPEVCEGCGDCGIKSNCVAVQPFETELGRKRKIDQSGCNKDFSCLDGFCPSFVTIEGAVPRKTKRQITLDDLPEPMHQVTADAPYSMLVTGVGGTGIVTIGGILGMAAHIEGVGFGSIDMAGLAQKGGSVFSHIKFAPKDQEISAIRVAEANADLLLGCDILVSADDRTLNLLSKKTHAFVNTFETMPASFARHGDLKFPNEMFQKRIEDRAGSIDTLNATSISTHILGDAIGANMLMLGVAYQHGRIPISADAILKAIELNGVAIEMNQTAFALGRQWVVDKSVLDDLMPNPRVANTKTLDEIVEDRAKRLVSYQNRAYSDRYIRQVEQARALGEPFAVAVANNLYKLMAYKDEYEVARLFSNGDFKKRLQGEFDGDFKLTYHLAPPIFSSKDPQTGRPRKKPFGAWMGRAFGVLAKGKILRGTMFDPFGYMQERKTERQLLKDYEAFLETASTYDQGTALALAELPDMIAGFGHVKEASIKEYRAALVELASKTALAA